MVSEKPSVQSYQTYKLPSQLIFICCDFANLDVDVQVCVQNES